MAHLDYCPLAHGGSGGTCICPDNIKAHVESSPYFAQAARDAALRRGVERLRDRLWASWKEGALNTAVSPLARELDAMLNEDAK